MTAGSETTSAAPRAGGRRYVLAWLGLCALTATSFGAHYLPLGGFAAPVALAIAAAKVGIVLVVFMHLLEESISIRFVALLNLLWVALLCAGIAADVLVR